MKKLLRIFLCVLAVILCATASLAHGGRTDINGGHTDNNNTSGLGRYHYHCGGNPAHLHEDCVCPYDTIETEISDEYGYYLNGEWHGLIIQKKDETEKRSGEIKLKEETEVKEEETSWSIIEWILIIIACSLVLFSLVYQIISPLCGLGVLIYTGIKKIVKKITKKDQP